ncbi:MAG: NADH-quinone oxidoreductase subunit K [Planctomycetaceae bacterium]|nr:sodium:proton antiporter [Planctomycetota bacterium]NUN53471.1 NADH-quinone oxidoreductase subunit K [Planctomycetaceae bacterium]
MILYALVLVLLGLGIHGLLAKRNLLKKIIALAILDYGVNLLLIVVGYRAGGGAPILLPGEDPAAFARGSVDPLPQALVLTSIVIGLGVTMLLVAMALRLHQRYGTLDVDRMDRLRG